MFFLKADLTGLSGQHLAQTTREILKKGISFYDFVCQRLH